MKRIWLIDATSYQKEIDRELLEIKKNYFIIKSYVRKKNIGDHILPTQRTFSTGLLRIATLLSRMGYSVTYFHLSDFLEDEVLANTITLPNIIAFSCVCPTIPICDKLSKRIKEINKSIITVVGGAHINVALNKTKQRYSSFDRYSYGYELEAVSRIIDTEVPKNVELLPYVDYSLLPYSLMEYDINVFSTLGCPFHCEYCQDGQMPYFEYLLDGGLSIIQNQLAPGKLIHFFDSTLGYSETRLMGVCTTLKKLHHPFILSCDLRAEFINPATVVALEEAGFKEIRIGFETNDVEVLKKNKRVILPETILDKIKTIRDYSGIYLTIYTVSGLPGYTLDTYKKNNEIYSYLLESRLVDEIKNAQYVPYPRDDVDFSKRGVIIKNNHWGCYDRQSYPVYETSELTQQQIWTGFIETQRNINQAWIAGLGFSDIKDLSCFDVYPEYIVNNYLERSNDND